MACFASGGDLGGGRYENGRICDGIFSSSSLLLSDFAVLANFRITEKSETVSCGENQVSE